ncbi:hypothetical protein CBL_13234 [Carabus blaptoides fortunei]
MNQAFDPKREVTAHSTLVSLLHATRSTSFHVTIYNIVYTAPSTYNRAALETLLYYRPLRRVSHRIIWLTVAVGILSWHSEISHVFLCWPAHPVSVRNHLLCTAINPACRCC